MWVGRVWAPSEDERVGRSGNYCKIANESAESQPNRKRVQLTSSVVVTEDDVVDPLYEKSCQRS